MFDIRILIFVIFSMLILYTLVEASLYRIHAKLTKIEKKLDAPMHKFKKGNNATDVKENQNDKKDKLK